MLQVIDRVRRKKRLAFHALQTQDRVEMEWYGRLAQKVVPTLYRMKGPSRPIPFVEDLAVPPKALADFLVRMQNVLKQHEVTASLFGHAGHGQLHIRPFLDLADPADAAKLAPLAADLYREVLDVGGTISGEHAAGLSRTAFIRQQYGPLADVFVDVKRIFDPQNLLNPGKVVHARSRCARASPSGDRAGRGGLRTAGRGRAGRRVEPGRGQPLPPLPTPIRLQLRWTHGRGGRGGPQLQRLRRLPLAIGRRADVSDFSPGPGRGKLAAGQGQRDARRAGRQARPGHAGQRRIQGRGRSVRELQDVPAGMSGQRRHSAIDDRRQGGLRSGQRPVDFRLDHVAHRLALGGGQHACGRWPIGPSPIAAARWLIEKTLGHRPGAQAAAVWPRAASCAWPPGGG